MKPILAVLFVSLAWLSSCTLSENSRLQATRPGTQQRSGAILLDLRTDKPTYKVGEPIIITLTASQRSTVEVWSEDARGKRTAVWPRAGHKKSAHLSAGQTLQLPPRGADWQILAAEPRGVNTLVAIAKGAPAATGHTGGGHSSSSANSGQPVFFQIPSGGGWKSDRGLTIESPESGPAGTGTGSRGASGEARWLYRVK